MERRVLGEEEIILIDGTKKIVKVYAVPLFRKMQINKNNREEIFSDGRVKVKIHDDKMMQETLEEAFQGQVKYEDIDYFGDDIYDKYFKKSAVGDAKKKDNTSLSSETKDDQSQ